ncbi:hypothetical protein P3T76_014881 [Phytophthora citrophthora]|uniref:BZIP domain-containing protein n=1 Tax=Phytophthora citrophthora TaxID=4793 RepID=A0AAD9LBX0_9STRA|nr:hypothetical protein P3T76_014881 [Phytophthora citrophthora]
MKDKKSPTSGTRKRQNSPLDEAGELELRRSRRRANMQRYRSKLRNHVVNLEDDVLQLREDTQKLQVHYDTTLASYKEKTAWSVTAEYFRLFDYGLKGDIVESKAGSNAQLGFLCANMAPDVVGLTGCGVERLIEDFRLLSLYLPSLSTRLLRLEMGPRESIIATTRVEFTLKTNTIRLAFPHLIQDGEWSPTALLLLDQRVVMQGTTHFEWDSESCRIILLQVKADLLTPMLKLLGDLETVVYVFEDALITPECTPARR